MRFNFLLYLHCSAESIANLIVRCRLPENLNYAKALNSVRPFHVNKE